MPKHKKTVIVDGRQYVSIKYIADQLLDTSQEQLRYFIRKKLKMKPEVTMSGYQYFSLQQAVKIDKALHEKQQCESIEPYKTTDEIAQLVSKSQSEVGLLLDKNGFAPVRFPFNTSGRELALWDKSAVNFCLLHYSKTDSGQEQTLFTVKDITNICNNIMHRTQVRASQIYTFLYSHNIAPKCKLLIAPNCKANFYGPEALDKVKAKFGCVKEFGMDSADVVNRDIAALQDRLKDEERQNKKLIASIASYKDQISEMSEQLKDYTKVAKYNGKLISVAELREILNQKDASIRNYKKDIKSYKKEIAVLQADTNTIDDLSVKIDALESRNTSLRKALNAETDGTLELNSKIKKQNENIKLLRKQKGELVEQLKELHLEMENLKKVNENLTKEPEIANNDAKRTSVISKLKLIFRAQ